MPGIKNNIAMKEHVINTLLYFDIFSYPLNAAEVFKFLRVNSCSQSDIKYCLDDLAEKKLFSGLEIFTAFTREIKISGGELKEMMKLKNGLKSRSKKHD